jgi:hypothetical protein
VQELFDGWNSFTSKYCTECPHVVEKRGQAEKNLTPKHRQLPSKQLPSPPKNDQGYFRKGATSATILRMAGQLIERLLSALSTVQASLEDSFIQTIVKDAGFT